MNISPAVIELYSESDLAVAFIQKVEESWQIVWQNATAHTLWGEYNLNSDLVLKAHIISAVQPRSAKAFSHFPQDGLQCFQFMLHHFQNGFILQFIHDAESYKGPLNLKYQESVCQVAVESAGLALFDWDLSSDLIHYSDSIYKLCNISANELSSSLAGLIERIHPSDRDAFREQVDAHLSEQWPLSIDFRFRSSSGEYVWLEMTGKSSKALNKTKPLRLMGAFRDISDQKRTEQTVYQRESLIEQIFDSLPVSIYVKDGHGCFRFFSKQAEILTGVNRNKAIGRTDFEVFSTETAKANVQLDALARQAGTLLVSEEKRQLDGHLMCLMSGRGPVSIQNLDQTPSIWILGFELDITERHHMEEALRMAKDVAEAATKAKSEFLSVMSHEIRTPLNAVIGTSSLLLDSELNEEQTDQMQMIKRSGEHLLYLINDILDFNKLDSEQMELEWRAFSLKEQLDIVVSILAPEAKMKGILFNQEMAEDVVNFMWGDEARVRQVLLNLIGNSIKFTEKGSVTLKVKTSLIRPGFSRFEIIDTGIGIDEKNMSKLFSEFMQADTSTTRKYGGTGLGLAICKKLVEAMKGFIGVDSVLGEGSCFWFEIPTPKANPDEIKAENLEQDFDEQQALKILVAEDNLSNQLLIRAVLTKLGHQIVLANNGKEAIDQLQQHADFDLVLMDMQMPELDGLEATRMIRQHQATVASNIPIIALTANALSGDKERVLEAGMNDYLTKPIDIHALKRALWKWSRT